LTMSPMVVGLTLTCWMARHRWDNPGWRQPDVP
jgi:hypothetical protein